MMRKNFCHTSKINDEIFSKPEIYYNENILGYTEQLIEQ